MRRDACGKISIGLSERNVPTQVSLCGTDRVAKAIMASSACAPRCGIDASVREQPLKVLCARLVETRVECVRVSNGSGDWPAMRRACTAQHRSACQQALSARPGKQLAAGLVEDDKLDVRNVRHQAGFGLADDPGDARVWPVILQAPDDGERMTGVADRREPHDADVLRLRLQQQIRHYHVTTSNGDRVR